MSFTRTELAIGLGLALMIAGAIFRKELIWLGAGIATGGYLGLIVE